MSSYLYALNKNSDVSFLKFGYFEMLFEPRGSKDSKLH